MTNPCIICVAITGSVPTKADNPAVPITVGEQIESTHAAYEAGASIAHCHVRNDDGSTSSDPEKFARLQEGLHAHCPDMIVQFSTGGRSGAGHERGGMLPLRPDMASLTVGSNNFPTRVYENSPDLVAWLAGEMKTYGITPEVEAFDLSHILQALEMVKDGRIHTRPYLQFVMGVKNAMPADREVFELALRTTYAWTKTHSPRQTRRLSPALLIYAQNTRVPWPHLRRHALFWGLCPNGWVRLRQPRVRPAFRRQRYGALVHRQR